ncbi:MAG: hypothetical protein ACOCQB_02175 [Halanaerobiaceae bacterium]
MENMLTRIIEESNNQFEGEGLEWDDITFWWFVKGFDKYGLM